jgi:hypothetical protein
MKNYNHKIFRLWQGLVLFAIIWGVITGLSLASESFWLDPTAAIFGCFGTCAIAASLAKASTDNGYKEQV